MIPRLGQHIYASVYCEFCHVGRIEMINTIPGKAIFGCNHCGETWEYTYQGPCRRLEKPINHRLRILLEAV